MSQFSPKYFFAFSVVLILGGFAAFLGRPESEYVPPSVIVRQRALGQGSLFKPFTPPPTQINSSEGQRVISSPKVAPSELSTSRFEVIRPTSEYKPFTQEELFRIQHPQSYINYLGTIESLMIQDGFLKPDEREVFDSEAKVLSF